MLIFFFAGILLSSLLTLLSSTPGYMDAAYYYVGGVNLAEGRGFFEQILWNFLDSPIGLPHPSHLYWMPLPSLLAALGLFLAGKSAYIWARIPFIVLSGLVPLITVRLAYRVTNSTRKAILAGLLAVFPGFYAIFMNHTETFSPFMVLGGLFFLMMNANPNEAKTILPSIFGLGLISGLMHLTRADGIVWYAGGVLYLLIVSVSSQKNPLMTRLKTFLLQTVILTLGYVLVMLPWFLRNVELFGSPLSPGGKYSFWFVDYDDLYFFPAVLLTPGRWLDSGRSAILAARWGSFIQNMQTSIAVQGEIFLFPFILAGFRNLWRNKRVLMAGLLWSLTFGVMTVIFPFAGERGGFFHSGAGFQPMLWVLAAEGLEQLIQWGVKKRNWIFDQAWNFLGAGLVVFSIFLTGFLTFNRVVGVDYPPNKWDRDWYRYEMIERELSKLNIPKDSIILINNPPLYYAANRRPSVVIPDGDINMTLDVADRYQVKILVLEENHPDGLDSIFDQIDSIPDRLEKLSSELNQVQMYRILSQ
jgi:hypothetical protein